MARKVPKPQKKPAQKKRASSPKARAKAPTLSPQQKGALTRAANKAAAEALFLRRQAAAIKAAETRAETNRVIEKGNIQRLTKAEAAFLEERSKKSRSPAVLAIIPVVVSFQAEKQAALEEAKSPSQKIKENLISLRREAIKNKVGWYPTKLVNSTLVDENKRPKPGSTWRETRTSPMHVLQPDRTRQLEDVTFGYNRRHERVGQVLTEPSGEEIKKKISDRYMEMIKESMERSPFTRGYIQVYGYVVAPDLDDSLVAAYAEFVRLRPPTKTHRIGRGDVETGKIIQKDPQNKLLLIVESGGISPDPKNAIEGAEEAINRWLMTLDKAVIVDSFFISIEERPFAKKKGDDSISAAIEQWSRIDSLSEKKRERRKSKIHARDIARSKARAEAEKQIPIVETVPVVEKPTKKPSKKG